MVRWKRLLSGAIGCCLVSLPLLSSVKALDVVTTPEALADALATKTESIPLTDGMQEALFTAAFALRPELGYFYGGSGGYRQNDVAEMTITYRWYGERGVRVVASKEELVSLLAQAMTLVQEEVDVVLLGAADAEPEWDFTSIFETAEQSCSLARTLLKVRSWRVWENDYSNDVYARFSMTYQQDTAEQAWEKKKQTEQAALQLAQSLYAKAMPPEQKALLAHDAIIRLCTYDSVNDDAAESHAAYGVFIPNLAVCEGYAEAYQLMMELAGIPCDIVTGHSDAGNGMEAHAWNRVTLGGAAYHVDCTWDDPTTDTGEPLLRHQYFLCSDAVLAKDHTWDTEQDPVRADGPLTFAIVKGELTHNTTVYDDYSLSYQAKCTDEARAAFAAETEQLRLASMQPRYVATAQTTLSESTEATQTTASNETPKAPVTAQTSTALSSPAPVADHAGNNLTLIIFWAFFVIAVVGVLFAKIHG